MLVSCSVDSHLLVLQTWCCSWGPESSPVLLGRKGYSTWKVLYDSPGYFSVLTLKPAHFSQHFWHFDGSQNLFPSQIQISVSFTICRIGEKCIIDHQEFVLKPPPLSCKQVLTFLKTCNCLHFIPFQCVGKVCLWEQPLYLHTTSELVHMFPMSLNKLTKTTLVFATLNTYLELHHGQAYNKHDQFLLLQFLLIYQLE